MAIEFDIFLYGLTRLSNEPLGVLDLKLLRRHEVFAFDPGYLRQPQARLDCIRTNA